MTGSTLGSFKSISSANSINTPLSPTSILFEVVPSVEPTTGNLRPSLAEAANISLELSSSLSDSP